MTLDFSSLTPDRGWFRDKRLNNNVKYQAVLNDGVFCIVVRKRVAGRVRIIVPKGSIFISLRDDEVIAFRQRSWARSDVRRGVIYNFVTTTQIK